MNITNKDFETLQKALLLFPKGEKFDSLSDEQKIIINNAKKTMENLEKKKQKDNERIAKYIAEKRNDNPNYAR